MRTSTYGSGGDAVAIDVNKLFVNVGSGATGRDFSARTSNARVVTVEVTDNPHVVVTPVGDGTATVTVGYTGGGSSISAGFDVAVGESRTATPPPPPDVPVLTLPLAGAGVLAGLLTSAAYRFARRPA